MRGWRGSHPRFETLSRLAADELSEKARDRVAAHVKGCARCRRVLAELDETERIMRSITTPKPPPWLFDQILDGLDRLEQPPLALVPDDGDGPHSNAAAHDRGRTGWTVRAVLVTMAVMAVLAGGSLLRPRTGMADASSLSIALSGSGDAFPPTLDLRYLAGAGFFDLDAVRVRGEVWTADAGSSVLDHPTSVETLVPRAEPGVFAASLELPANAVFARLSVEDIEGLRVDLGTGPPWEYASRGADGLLTRDALLRRHVAYRTTDSRIARATAEELTSRFPDDPVAWALRATVDLQAGGGDRGDAAALVGRFRAELDRLHGLLAAEPLTADATALLADFARRVGDDEKLAFWRNRLLSERPSHVIAGDLRRLDIYGRFGSDPPKRLAALEAEWRRWPGHTSMPPLGFDTAVEVGDPEQVLLWGLRFVDAWPHESARVAAAFVLHGVAPGAALDVAGRRLRQLDEPGSRGFAQLRSSARREILTERGRLFGAVGEALIAAGDTALALDTLAAAAESAWDPGLFDRVAELRLVRGDSLGAAALMALLAADPIPNSPTATVAAWEALPALDSDALQQEGSVTFQRFWSDRLDDVPISAELSGPDIGATTLSAVLNDADVALVAYWYTAFPVVPASIERFGPLASTVDALSLPVIGVIGDLGRQGPAAFERLPDPGWEILHDAAGELRAVMRLWPTATYLVVQDGRRIRFAGDLEDAIRVAVALRSADG